MGVDLVREVREAYRSLRHPPTRMELVDDYGFNSPFLSRLFSDTDPKSPRGENRQRLEELLDHLRVLHRIETGANKLVPVYDGPVPQGAAARMNMSSMVPMGDGSEGYERLGRKIKDDSLAPLFRSGDIAVFDSSPWQDGELVYAVSAHSEADVIGFVAGDDVEFTIEPLDGKKEGVSSLDGWTILGVAKGRLRVGLFDRDEKHFTVRMTREVVRQMS